MIQNSTTAFSEWLKHQRTARGLTHADLARQIHCAPVTLRMLESGTRKASRQIAALLAEAFGIPSDEYDAFITFARSAARPAPSHDGQAPQSNGHGPVEPDAPWRTLYARLHKVPAPATGLIGRERDLLDVQTQLLEGRNRLLTILGPPGVGKTSLAIAIGRSSALADRFPDGIFFVPLAPLGESSQVPGAIASVLGLQESGSVPLEQLVGQYLAGKRLLLIVDNFEHVIGAATLVADLLSSGPWVRVLVTSRELLHVRGEQVYSLGPLAAPEPLLYEGKAGAGSSQHLSEYPAVALFVERAAAANPSFALSDENAGEIARLCAALDGLPLAIELVAAQGGALMLGNPSAPLEGDVLRATGWRDLPQRHQTLRDAITWSYRLLPESEQQLFRLMAAFAGDASLQAVVETAGATGVAGRRSVTTMLSALVRKSLLRRETATEGEPRFGMLATIRSFAWEELEGAGQAEQARREHALYFTRLAERARVELTGADDLLWYEQLRREENNLRLALTWLLSSGDDDSALRLVGGLGRYWYVQSRLTEGRLWLDRALALHQERGAKGLEVQAARAYYWLGVLSLHQLGVGAGDAAFRQGLALARAGGNNAEALSAQAQNLLGLGTYTRQRGDFEQSRCFAEESARLYREIGDNFGLGLALFNVSLVYCHQSDAAAEERMLDEAEPFLRMAGSKQYLTYILSSRARLAGYARGAYDRAARASDDAIASFQQNRDLRALVIVYTERSELERHNGRVKEAAEWGRAALKLAVEIGERSHLHRAFEDLALTAGCIGDSERAVRLLAKGRQLRLMYMPGLGEQRGCVEMERQLRADLGDEAYGRTYQEGIEMSVEHAISYALAED